MDQPLQLPTNLHVLDNFRAPLCQWCAGNRGIEYQTEPGSVVSAAASGIATFVGTVAGTRYVVVRAGNTVLVTHGRLASVIVKTGDTVVIGHAIGVARESLYIGVRVDGQYADPRYCAGLGSWGKPRAVLVAG
jgi:septal ring factor EnvC (AmiA/AmiB activator)